MTKDVNKIPVVTKVINDQSVTNKKLPVKNYL